MNQKAQSKPHSKHPEDTNKNYNAQNTQENILKNRKGSDLSNVEKPAPGTSKTFQSAQNEPPRNQEREIVDPNVS